MKAVARQATLDLQSPMSPDRLGNLVEEMLLMLARDFSIKGVVPGHIKALVEEDESYCSFSCTKPGKVTRQTSFQKEDTYFHQPCLYLNVVLVGVPEEKAEVGVDICLEKFLNSVRSSTRER